MPARNASQASELADGDVALLVRRIRDRVVRALRRAGKWPEEHGGGELDDLTGGDEDERLLLAMGAAAVQGRSVHGERDRRAGQGSRDEPFVRAPLCADIDGFSLHAGVVVPGHARDRLERLCRYAGRPAIAESRLSLLPDGRVCYALKRRWEDGSTHVVMEPQVLIERLVALVPRPRKHLVTYHGVLAPASGLRSRVVPPWQADEEERAGWRHVEGEEREIADEASCRLLPRSRKIVPHAPGKRRRGGGGAERRRYPWAELLRRVFEVDVLVCPRCGGRRKVLAAIHDPESIAKVLGAMGLDSAVPELMPARGPPGDGVSWGA